MNADLWIAFGCVLGFPVLACVLVRLPERVLLAAACLLLAGLCAVVGLAGGGFLRP